MLYSTSAFITPYQAASLGKRVERMKKSYILHVANHPLQFGFTPNSGPRGQARMDTSPTAIPLFGSIQTNDTVTIRGSAEDICIQRPLRTVSIHDVRDATVRLGPCSGAILLENCHNVLIVGAAQQLRLNDCSEVIIRMWIATSVNLQDCRQVRVETNSDDNTAPYAWYASFETERVQFGPLGKQNNCSNIVDFSSDAPF